MNALNRVPLSILDLCPIVRGGTAAQAFANARDLAQHAEGLGYVRYWLAEHHNLPGIASAATSVVIGHVAAGTRTIRVGSGGVMLANHSPLAVAEQFGTLESLFPGRIDLGVGRAPGTDPRTTYALRRERTHSADFFAEDLKELRNYFRSAVPNQAVRAVPGVGLHVPIWLLGSSLYSARLAAVLGLPYAFAGHFAPDQLYEALEIYRAEFRPSETLDRPHVMAATNAFAAATDAEARRLFTSVQQQFLQLRRGEPGPVPPPVDSVEGLYAPEEIAGVAAALREAVVGSPDTVRQGLQAFVERTRADELMVTAQIYDHAARRRSFEIVAQAATNLAPARLAATA